MRVFAIKESFYNQVSYVLSFSVKDFKEFFKQVSFIEVHGSKVIIKAPKNKDILFIQEAYKPGEIIEGELFFRTLSKDIIVSGSRSAIYDNFILKKDEEIISLTLEFI